MALSVVQLGRGSRPRPSHLSLASRGASVTPPPTWSERSIGVFGFGFRSEASVPRPRAKSRSVLFCVQPSQDGVFHGVFSSVPDSVAALLSGVSPQTLVKILRRVRCIGVLTANVIFVHLSYACHHVAGATRHVPVGGGALAGAVLVLSYGEGCLVWTRWNVERDRHTVFIVVVTRFLDRGRGAFAPASPNNQDQMCAVVTQLLPLPACSPGHSQRAESRWSLSPERGLCAVFSGDNSLVLFRLQPSQDGLLSPSPAL